MMAKPKAPCLGCNNRHQLCWNSCEIYKSYKTELDEFNQRRRDTLNSESNWFETIHKGQYPNKFR